MALILAVNPGGKHSPALARLARELPGYELNGADSCAVAIAAIDRRMPDLVLLPPLPKSDEREVLARLSRVPGGVRVLQLPPLLSDDPRLVVEFADQVRQSLAAPPAASPVRPDDGRAHLVAAATAMVSWVRARRATWTDASMAQPVREAPPKAAARQAARKVTAEPKPVSVEEAAEHRAPPEAAESVPASGIEASARSWADWRARGPQRGSRVGVLDPIRRWLPRVAALAIVAAVAVGALTYLPKLTTGFTSGVLVLESGPAGSEVFIDGRLVGVTPISVELPAGRHSVEFRSGAQSRTTDVTVVARARVIERVDWMATPTGTLEVRSDPAGAQVLVDGARRGTTPLTLDSLAVGTHVVTLESQAGSIRRTVTIGAGQTAQLTESIFPGWLAVFAPFEIEIVEGSVVIQPDDRGRAMLPAGPHKLRFRNPELGYDEVRAVEINPGDTTTLNLTPQTTISVTATEPSEVWIDGTSVGQTPVTNRRIALGTRVILVRPATGDERQFTVTATPKPVRIDVDFSKPPM